MQKQKSVKPLLSKGFSHVEFILLIIVVVIIGAIGTYVFKHRGTSHAGNTYTSIGTLSYGGVSFTAQACITAQTGTAPNQMDTVNVLISANAEVGPSVTSTISSPTSAQLATVSTLQSALSTAENQLSIDKATEAKTLTVANAAAVTALTSRVNDVKTGLATATAAESTTTSVFNPSAYYEINGGSPVTEDSWVTGGISMINFNVPSTIQTASLSIGLVGSNANYVGGSNTAISSIALCSATSAINVPITSIGGALAPGNVSSSQLSMDENVVAADLTALNNAKAAIVDEQSPTSAQEAAITSANTAYVNAENKVATDKGTTAPATTPKTTSAPATTPKTTSAPASSSPVTYKTITVHYTSNTIKTATLQKGSTVTPEYHNGIIEQSWQNGKLIASKTIVAVANKVTYVGTSTSAAQVVKAVAQTKSSTIPVTTTAKNIGWTPLTMEPDGTETGMGPSKYTSNFSVLACYYTWAHTGSSHYVGFNVKLAADNISGKNYGQVNLNGFYQETGSSVIVKSGYTSNWSNNTTTNNNMSVKTTSGTDIQPTTATLDKYNIHAQIEIVPATTSNIWDNTLSVTVGSLATCP